LRSLRTKGQCGVFKFKQIFFGTLSVRKWLLSIHEPKHAAVKLYDKQRIVVDGYYPHFYLLNLSLLNGSHAVATVGNTV